MNFTYLAVIVIVVAVVLVVAYLAMKKKKPGESKAEPMENLAEKPAEPMEPQVFDSPEEPVQEPEMSEDTLPGEEEEPPAPPVNL